MSAPAPPASQRFLPLFPARFIARFIGVKTVLYPNPRHVRLIRELVYRNNATALFGTDFFLNAWARSAEAAAKEAA